MKLFHGEDDAGDCITDWGALAHKDNLERLDKAKEYLDAALDAISGERAIEHLESARALIVETRENIRRNAR